MTERLLRDHPDLQGLCVSGGGITGAIAALHSAGRAGRVMTVGNDLISVTRAALLDGTVQMIIAHPLDRLATQLIRGMAGAGSLQRQLPMRESCF